MAIVPKRARREKPRQQRNVPNESTCLLAKASRFPALQKAPRVAFALRFSPSINRSMYPLTRE